MEQKKIPKTATACMQAEARNEQKHATLICENNWTTTPKKLYTRMKPPKWRKKKEKENERGLMKKRRNVEMKIQIFQSIRTIANRALSKLATAAAFHRSSALVCITLVSYFPFSQSASLSFDSIVLCYFPSITAHFLCLRVFWFLRGFFMFLLKYCWNCYHRTGGMRWWCNSKEQLSLMMTATQARFVEM